ncbi:MAG: hypothetical protein OXC96_05965 [Cyanobacteria bacterium MAG CAR1_bin_15]|nr:hypothetical protein [Cyanobacteria bacterium MAG CAR1_bin_15]
MPLPPRRLLAGSAVAGLLFLLPAESANAQNRNTWGWGGAGVGVLSFIAAAGGAAVGVKLASKDKRDDEIMKSAFAELDSSIKTLEGKLPKSEATSQEGIQELSRTLESKTNLESKIDMISTSLGTVQFEFTELNSSFKELDKKLKEYINDNIKDYQALNSLLSEAQEALDKCENEKRSLKMLETEKEHRSKEQENMDRQWK